MNRKINWNVCHGCECYDKEEYDCLGRVLPYYNNEKCPCLKCLLKMCCSKSCPDFSQYADTFDRSYNDGVPM
jgi:hypothetical protein